MRRRFDASCHIGLSCMARVACLTCLGVMLCGSVALAAEDLEGKVVSAGEGKITFVDKNKEEQVLEVAADAKIVRGKDKKAAKLSDLQEGDTVTIKVESRKCKSVAVSIVAIPAE